MEDVCDGLDDEQAAKEVEKLAREYNLQEGVSHLINNVTLKFDVAFPQMQP